MSNSTPSLDSASARRLAEEGAALRRDLRRRIRRMHAIPAAVALALVGGAS